MVNDNFYLSLALKEAWRYQGLTYPNPAVGAVVVDKYGKILSISAHKKHGLPHAELNAIKEAFVLLKEDKDLKNLSDATQIHSYILKNHNDIFKECKIYVTLEPCNHYGSTPPCSLLIKTLGFKEVIIGSLEENKTAAGGVQALKNTGIRVKTGVLKKQCDELLYPFKKWQKDRFILFKIATNLNGSYDTGIISSKTSREFVHKLRDKIDLLVIGGNTVRIDRPVLDSRLIGGKAPDVLIYSRQKEFDRSIALFNVPNRQVYIADNFEILKRYKFIMFEGTNTLFEATKEIVDWHLFFISPDIKQGKTLQTDAKLKPLWHSCLENDTMIWFGH